MLVETLYTSHMPAFFAIATQCKSIKSANIIILCLVCRRCSVLVLVWSCHVSDLSWVLVTYGVIQELLRYMRQEEVSEDQ